MLSYTGLRNKFGVVVNNTNSTILTNADIWLNEAHRIFIAETNGYFTEATATDLTEASVQNYPLPFNCEKLNTVTIVEGNFNYPIKPIFSRERWDMLQLTTNITADPPEYYFIDAQQIYFWPTPATADLTINFNYKKRVIDLNTADITGTTITTLTQGAKSLTVSAGLTVQMAGFWIRPTFDTAANTGDGNWYEIASVTNATTATLIRDYGGTSIAAGTAACTIAQMPIIPEAFHPSLVDYAVAEYWDMNHEPTRAAVYRNKWNDALHKGKIYAATKTTNMVVDEGTDLGIINPNLTIEI